MNDLAKLLNSYSGRDCTIRTISYLSLYLSGHTNGVLSHKFKFISQELSYCRLILRLFDDLPMLKYSFSYGLGREERSLFLRVLGVLKNITDQLFYPVEHIAWAADKHLINARGSSWWTAGTLLWALSSYISIIRSLILMSLLQRKTYGLKNIVLHENIIKEQLELLLSAFKDVANIVLAVNYLPSGSLLWAGKLTTKQIGLFGLVSSLLRLLMLYRNLEKPPTKSLA